MGRRPKNTVKYKVPENTYLHIEAFMVNDLHLSGNELIIYAAIFGFSQDGSSWFTGSRKYLGGWCQITDETVTYNLNKLLKKGLIECREKKVHDVVFKDYRAVPVIFGGAEKSVPLDEKPVPDPEKTSHPTEKTPPHTIDAYNSSHTIDHTKKKERKKPSTFDAIIAERTSNPDLVNAIGEFIRMRARIKKPLTDYALTLRLNKLWRLGSTDEERIAIVQQSIGACWQDFFPLKDDTTRRRRKSASESQMRFGEYPVPSEGGDDIDY